MGAEHFPWLLKTSKRKKTEKTPKAKKPTRTWHIFLFSIIKNTPLGLRCSKAFQPLIRHHTGSPINKIKPGQY